MDEGLVKTSDLIVVKQLPIIEDRLDEAYAAVKERLSAVSGLVVTEDNYKELKKTRADLNREFDDLETLRKRVKSAIEVPYKKFEGGAYKRLADEYERAIAELDGNIKETEGVLRDKKKEELLAYYEEYRQSVGVDAGLGDFKKSGIKVGLSGTMKSLKEQARAHLDGIVNDLAMIDTLENADEVLAEYRDCLVVQAAVRVVNERHKKVAEERKRREAEEEARKQKEARIEAVEAAVGPPTESVATEEEEVVGGQVLSTKYLGYEIFGTLEQLKGLKGYLQEALMEYCEMEGLKYGSC